MSTILIVGRAILQEHTRQVSCSLIDLDARQVPEAARVLARAFVDNPGVIAVLDRHSHEARRQAFEHICVGFLAAARRYGTVVAAMEHDRLAGVILFYPPGAYPLPAIGQMLMAKPVALTGPRASWKFLCLDVHLRRVHPRTRHYFGFMLGIDPRDQGKGYGGKLLRRMTDLADSAGIDCYLETDKPESVLLYERFGYRVNREDTIRPLNNLRVWTMTRPPR